MRNELFDTERRDIGKAKELIIKILEKNIHTELRERIFLNVLIDISEVLIRMYEINHFPVDPMRENL